MCRISDADEVLQANRSFYEAFEAQDLDAMSALWEHSDRVVCTHPGWTTLRGWASVGASFFALFQGTAPMQFILTAEQVEVGVDTAWVSLDENLLQDEVGAAVAALNVFIRTDAGWRMVVHHGSAVAGSG